MIIGIEGPNDFFIFLEEILAKANRTEKSVTETFKGIKVTVNPGDDLKEVMATLIADQKKECAACKENLKILAENAKPEMTFKEKGREKWEYLKSKIPEYPAAGEALACLEKWACLMESYMASEKIDTPTEECFEKTFCFVRDDMRASCPPEAIGLLMTTWIHGDKLKEFFR